MCMRERGGGEGGGRHKATSMYAHVDDPTAVGRQGCCWKAVKLPLDFRNSLHRTSNNVLWQTAFLSTSDRPDMTLSSGQDLQLLLYYN